jgi:hypothetical protein
MHDDMQVKVQDKANTSQLFPVTDRNKQRFVITFAPMLLDAFKKCDLGKMADSSTYKAFQSPHAKV